MRDIWNELTEWVDNDKAFSIARVIHTWRSAPRASGAGMIVGEGMEIAGSVSGGCIEGAVIEEALEVLKDGKPRKLNYGVEDELALSVGLSCGGEVSVLVEKHWAFSEEEETRKVWMRLQEALQKNEPAVLLSKTSSSPSSPLLVLPEGDAIGDWGDTNENAKEAALEAYRERENRLMEIGDEETFIQVFPRRDQLLIIGAGHITLPLVQFANALDFQTVVIDPRKVFATQERFVSKPDHLIDRWPQDILEDWPLHEDTYAILLTHDPKIDDPALKILLKHDLPYIGALGSRKTHAKRCARLEEAGISQELIQSIKGPAGLDIGAKTAGEIALSMLSEVIAAKRGNL
jgi:xanthine dehydrogenase accessory factor